MRNPFRSFRPSMRKWKQGTRLQVIKTTCALLTFLACVYFIFQFAKVQTKEAYLQLRKYQRTGATAYKPDSLKISIYNFYNSTQNTLRMDGGTKLYVSIDEDTTATIRKDKKTDAKIDSLLKCWPDTNIEQMAMGAWQDSLYAIYDLYSSMKLSKRPLFGKNESDNDEVVYASGRDEHLCFSLKSDCTPEGSYNKVRYHALVGFMKGCEKKKSNRALMDGTMYEDLDYFYFLREGDLSQSYYKLQFPHTKQDSAVYNDITHLSIDFAGATRFVGLNPVPDEVTLTGFCYTDSVKLRQIFKQNEFTFYCQYLEASNIQTVRTYLISTIATFFIGLFLRLLFGLLCTLRPLPPLKRCWQWTKSKMKSVCRDKQLSE